MPPLAEPQTNSEGDAPMGGGAPDRVIRLTRDDFAAGGHPAQGGGARPRAASTVRSGYVYDLGARGPSGPREPGGRPLYRAAKRAFDVAFSAAVVAVGLVPGLVLCAFVARDTGGSPIYSQERVGRGGEAFRLYKFRTMVADADDVEKYLNEAQLAQWRAERKVDDDPRITRLGRVLRATSIDEFPQFINVLAHQMSVIGPRAITRDELESWYSDEEREELLSVPVGITGLWQTGPRNNCDFDSGKRQELELSYVRNAGFALDAKLFFKTFGVMVRETGR